jgi:colanic acid biosynthesis glycosyl transferase WcaI
MNLSGKTILLIGYNFWPEPTGIGKYSGEMIEWLAEKGVHCTVITTYPYYPFWKVQEPYRAKRFFFSSDKKRVGDGTIRILRCPVYIPKNPSGLKRMIQDATFFLSSTAAAKYLAFTSAKNEYTIAVAPSFFVGFPALIYRLLRRNKILYHIQDLQIEAAEKLGMIKSPFLLSTLYRLEKYILKRVDAVSSISEAMVRKVKDKTQTPVHLFPNWSDTDFFRPIEDSKSLKRDFGFDPEKKLVLYSGAVGRKQGLEMILDAAESFVDKKIHFVICGTGPYSEVLNKDAETRGIENLSFRPLLPLEKFNAFLNMADVHLVIQKSGASDLLLPSKLTNILSVGGLALITASPGTSLHQLNEKHNLAIVVEPENQKAFEKGLETALETDSKNSEKCFNARRYAESYLNKDSIMNSISRVFEELKDKS